VAEEKDEQTPEPEAATGKAEGKKAEGEKPKPKRTRKPAAKKDDAASAEEKPKPRRRAAAKKDDAAEQAKAEEAAKETKAEEAEADGEPPAEDEQAKPKAGGRRGGAAAAGRTRTRRAKPGAASPNGDVTVRARARYVRCAPRKARLVIDHIRGKGVDEARAILMHTPRAASRDVLKLLNSAIANAENNHELVADELRVGKAYVDEGPTLKRYRPRALGRATRIRKRTSHLTIELVSKE
jgi:ribosomal protein L22